MCSIAEYFYLLFVLWFALQACQNKAQFVYIFKYKWKNQRGRIDSLAPTVLEKQCVLFDSFTYIYSALLPQHWVLYAKVDSTPHLYVCTYIYIYFFFICPHVHSLENTLRTSSSLTPAGKFPINTWWLSGALRAVSLASLVFIPPRASLDERAGAGWGLGGGCKTGWERGWKKKKKKRNNKLTWCSRYLHAWKYLSTTQFRLMIWHKNMSFAYHNMCCQ